jgi:hypothetical protein
MASAQTTDPVHSLASAAGRLSALPQHPMSHLRIIFLVVLVLSFCSLFIGSYIWMRRPSFGQLGQRMAKSTAAGVEDPKTREAMHQGGNARDPGGITDQNGPVRSPSDSVSRRFSE